MNLLIYFALIVVVCTIAYLTERTKNVVRVGDKECLSHKTNLPWFGILIIALILSLYSATLGVREGMIDRERYIYSFLFRYPDYYTSFESFLAARTEPGYLLLNLVIWKITRQPFWLFFIITFITSIMSIYALLKLGKRYTMLIFLYLTSLYFFNSTYLFRQAIAVSIGNIALIQYLKGKRSMYFIFSFLACMFHSTAVVLFLLYFVYEKSHSKVIYIALFLGSIMSFLLYGPLFGVILSRLPFIGKYLAIDTFAPVIGGGSLNSIFKGLPFYFITATSLVKRHVLRMRMKNADLMIISSILYSLSWLSTYNMYWFFRIGWYSLLPTLILIPELIDSFEDKRERALIFMAFVFPLIVITFRQLALVIR